MDREVFGMQLLYISLKTLGKHDKAASSIWFAKLFLKGPFTALISMYAFFLVYTKTFLFCKNSFLRYHFPISVYTLELNRQFLFLYF